jgi:hypothetical protein
LIISNLSHSTSSQGKNDLVNALVGKVSSSNSIDITTPNEIEMDFLYRPYVLENYDY